MVPMFLSCTRKQKSCKNNFSVLLLCQLKLFALYGASCLVIPKLDGSIEDFFGVVLLPDYNAVNLLQKKF